MPLGAFKLNSIARRLAPSGPPTFNTITATGGEISDVQDNGVWYRLHKFLHRQRKTITPVGNAQISTAQSKFGGSSLTLPGTDNNYLRVHEVNNGFSPGLGDYTVECWIYRLGTSTNSKIVDARYSTSNRDWLWDYTTALRFFENGAVRITGGAISLSTWTHVAIVRQSSVVKMYINGVQSGSSYTSTYNITPGIGFFGIGANPENGAFPFNGHIDEVRVSNSARYTANFTAPTTQFVNDANTLLLLHMNDRNGSTVFEDDNTGNSTSHTFQVTNLGSSNGKIQTFILAGGGSGGSHDGIFRNPGGGGAGGLLQSTVTVSATSYAITVGGGGAGRSGRNRGNNGINSTGFSLTAVGGGAGAPFNSNVGSSGGSGGGAATNTFGGGTPWAGGAGTSGQGFDGGVAYRLSDTGGGGGGGGAGAKGQDGGGGDGVAGKGGNGGAGINSSFDGISKGYAGGGGSHHSVDPGTASHGGGAGGFGAANLATNRGQNGQDNTGGGSGSGAGSGYTILNSGDGGCGIVMVRYPINSANNLP
jgi:hypothetical protein